MTLALGRSSRHTRLGRGAGLLAATASAAALLAIAPVPAAAMPAGDVATGPFRAVQARVAYTVYVPTTTLGLRQSDFQRVPCGPNRGTGFSVDYGVEAPQGGGTQSGPGDPWISMNQSPGRSGCIDGPDGVAPATTFTVRGATAQVFGQCPDPSRQCTTSTPALAAEFAYTVVVLPPAGGRTLPTHVAVYSQELPVSQVKRFVRGLVPLR